MPATVATAADAARWTAAQAILSNILLNGIGGALTVAAPLGITPPPSMLSSFEAVLLALWQLSESTSPVLPLQMPVFANGAALPSAATWPGGFALVSSLGAAGQPVYSDGTNWRRCDTNSTTIP